MHEKQAILALADGTVYQGYSIGAEGNSVGELVFNTSMTGYQEILTDPSYTQQIVLLTTAHVGNTGCNTEDWESAKAWAAGLIIRDCPVLHSNYRAENSLPEWLKANQVVAIAGIDTRALTIRLRDQGAATACISTDIDHPEQAIAKARAFKGLEGTDLALEAGCQAICNWEEGQGQWAIAEQAPEQFHVVAYDFGVKYNILRILKNRGCKITLVPAQTSAEEALALKPDGIMFSNGPGDPVTCTDAIEATRQFLDRQIPFLGICLGFQILALACGAKTVKMKFGHHGSNHPVGEVSGEKRVFITSQNHGFTVDEATLPAYLEVTHRSLFDNSLQGIKHKEKPAFGFQGHPESSPGPHDIEILFDGFITQMKGK